MNKQATLPLPGGWPPPRQEVETSSDHPRFHPRSLAPRELDEAGCFDYSVTPAIFLGRSGFGPLRVAWDTNILIDWRDFGEHLLSDEGALPAGIEPTHEEELDALGALMTTIWATRDIRIYPLRRQLRDFGRSRRRMIDPRLVEQRERQLAEIASALWCVGLMGEFRRSNGRPPSSWWQARWMNPSPDRALLEEAIVRGCHVFLTRDQKVIRHRVRLASLGIASMAPSGLLDALFETGEMNSVAGPDGAICDNHKWQHLEAAAAGVVELAAQVRPHERSGGTATR